MRSRRRFLLGLGLLLALLLVAATTGVVVHRRQADRLVANMRESVGEAAKILSDRSDRCPRTDGRPLDLNAALNRVEFGFEWRLDVDGHCPSLSESVTTIQDPVNPAYRQPVLDVWGHAIRYRRPGKLHPDGFDIWSAGPNGVDEDGEGDDIVAGADLYAAPDAAPLRVRPR